MKFLYNLGRYFILLKRVFERPEKQSIYRRRFFDEIEKLGLNSIGIVFIISFFIGAVLTIQTAYNMTNPLFPRYLIGLGVRDSLLLEFSSTIVALILAGKVGSGIAKELGTMRITEQIDALEIMGINSASYLIFPKIVAMIVFNPFLTLISNIVGIFGGLLVAVFTDYTNPSEFIFGLQYAFTPYYLVYALIKSVVFAFLITTISAFYGYNVRGGAIDISKASTVASVQSSIFVLTFNLILTNLLL